MVRYVTLLLCNNKSFHADVLDVSLTSRRVHLDPKDNLNVVWYIRSASREKRPEVPHAKILSEHVCDLQCLLSPAAAFIPVPLLSFSPDRRPHQGLGSLVVKCESIPNTFVITPVILSSLSR